MVSKKKLKKILDRLEHLSKKEKKDILKDLRNDIDLMDRNIASHLAERFNLVFMIGQIKKSLNIQTYLSKRETEILKNITAIINGNACEKSIKKIYTKIIEESRLIQNSSIELSPFFNDKNKLGDNH